MDLTTLVTVGKFALGGVILSVYFYAIFLANALYDYQDEKPNDEKGPSDVESKDLMKTTYYFLCFLGFVQFISVFCPPVTSDIVYPISYFFVFYSNFSVVSHLVFVYIQFLYVFYPDYINNIPVSSLRQRSFAWKILLTIISVSISIMFPFEEQPILFTLLTKRRQYDRYLFAITTYKQRTHLLSTLYTQDSGIKKLMQKIT